MADASEKKSTELPIPALASVLLLIVGALVHQLNPLDSPRPATPNSVSSRYVNIEDVNARLWQDPFTAIAQHEPAKDYVTGSSQNKDSLQNQCISASRHNIEALVKSIVCMADPQNPNITVLGVMVSGGAYVENIESRRRTRYAVLSGLAVKDYAPDDHEHIGYVEKLKEGYMKDYDMPEKIPFEWFRDDKNGMPALLVLWLDDTAFATTRRPLQMTSYFVEQTKKAVEEAAKLRKIEPVVTFKFLGPASSDTLQIMLDELHSLHQPLQMKSELAAQLRNAINTVLTGKGFKQEDTSNVAFNFTDANALQGMRDRFRHLEYYNAIATGDWPGMSIPATVEKNYDKDKKTIRTYAESLGLNSLFTRTSLTDYQLAQALLKELMLRGFEIKNPPVYLGKTHTYYQADNDDHIVIISEWDTIYGRRGLPRAMKEQLVPMDSYCNEDEIRNNQCNWRADVNWVHSFSYMRGLDGVTPDTDKNTEGAKDDKQTNKNNSADINLERSEGQNQQDYLRRLAAHIDELNQVLKNRSEGKEKIKAIGVLGSDAYDKLMILKALRPYFPRAVFFTTDLDARLMHPKEFDVTRNLIVAASFNLQLAERLQQSIPPFRDSYQTANFFATQIAVDDANNPQTAKLPQDTINTMLGTARLFETGNNKAIALNYGNGACNALPECKNAHPRPTPKNWPFNVLVVILLTLIFWITPFVYLLKKYWDLEATRKLPTLLVGVFATLTFILIVLAFYVACYTELFFGEQGEPFFWHEGISIWSSELIRLLAGILGCLFIANTITVVAQNNRQLTTDFDLTASSQGNVAAFWQAHCASRQWYFFWGAFGVICVLFWSVVIIKWPDFFLPSVPYRGEISYYANNIVLCFSVPIFIILLTLVLVTTWHDIRFFIKLDRSYSIWPHTTLRRFGLRPWGVISQPQSDANNQLRVLRETLEAQNNYYLDEWLDIKFIVARSKVIGQLLYYPFIILALMIFSHSKIFDNWDIPTGLIIGFLSVAIPSFICAFYLRRVAEHARKNSIEKISNMKIALSYQSDNDGRKAMEKQIDMALAHIQAINTGAFQPLTSDPAFQALLIPFGGVGGVMLLENFVLNGF